MAGDDPAGQAANLNDRCRPASAGHAAATLGRVPIRACAGCAVQTHRAMRGNAGARPHRPIRLTHQAHPPGPAARTRDAGAREPSSRPFAQTRRRGLREIRSSGERPELTGWAIHRQDAPVAAHARRARRQDAGSWPAGSRARARGRAGFAPGLRPATPAFREAGGGASDRDDFSGEAKAVSPQGARRENTGSRPRPSARRLS